MRGCILSIIPGDVAEAAVEECDKTLAGGGKEPLTDRIRKMSAAFAGMENPVSSEQLETFLGNKLDSASEQQLVRLRKIFTSLRDGVAKREDFFPDLGSAVRFDAPAPAAETAPRKRRTAEATAPATEPTPSPEPTVVAKSEPVTPSVAPVAAAPVAPAAPSEPDLATNPHGFIQFKLDQHGVKFDDFRDWLKSAGHFNQADSMADVNDLPKPVAAKIIANDCEFLRKCVKIHGKAGGAN
jgi:hypothetical protein